MKYHIVSLDKDDSAIVRIQRIDGENHPQIIAVMDDRTAKMVARDLNRASR